MSEAKAPSPAESRASSSRSRDGRIQTKLAVGRDGDRYEQEADRAAATVTSGRPGANAAADQSPAVSVAAAAPVYAGLSRLNGKSLSRQPEEEEQAQTKVQRQEEEEEPAQTKVQRQEEEEEPAQTKAEARANVRDKRQYPVLDRVEQKLFENKGKGESLPNETRVEMETGFGADFGGVRVHSGAAATEMSRDLKAQAFTHGKDIFFNAGKFEPEAAGGKQLLAHELTHVVQQGAAEAKVPEQTVARNNAERTKAAPDPAEVVAGEAEEEVAAGAEGTAVDAATGAEGSDATAPPASGTETEKAAEDKAAKDKAPDGEAGTGAPKNAAAKEPAAAAKPAAKGSGVGALLRKVTAPIFAKKKAAAARMAGGQKPREKAADKLAQTEKAVVPPAAEAQSRAQADQVQTVEQAPAPVPDEALAKRQFDTALTQSIPKTLEDVDKFKEEGRGRVVGAAVQQVVAADTSAVQETYQQIESPPAPAPAATAPEELPPVEAAPPAPALELGQGVVGEVPAEETDLSSFEEESDDLLTREEIKEEHLDMVDEGDLAEANKERKKVKKTVQEAPGVVKAVEAEEKQKVNQELQQDEQAGKDKIQAERQAALTGARGDQTKTKTKLEMKRQQVTEHIQGIYDRANTTVKQKLTDLEQQSLASFDNGEQEATRTFEANVKSRMDAFKTRRYDRFGGSLLWAKDKLFGMDDLPEVKGIFDSERARFVAAMDTLTSGITAANKLVIQECKDIVAAARTEIAAYVEELGPALKETGQAALGEIQGKLDALNKGIDEKAKALQEQLAAKREAAIQAIEKKIEQMKEEMSGALSKLGNLLLNAAIKFFEWALKKAGMDSQQLMGIINKGQEVIKKIVTDPLGFLGNFISAVKNGVGLFVTNIKKHLITGLIDWLTGAMSEVPITLPSKWDLKGILSLVLQILGLTWERIRAKLVKRVGEKVVKAAETTFDIVKRLVTEGPMALWEMIKEKAAELKQNVMDGIRNWIITQVVKQAVIKLLSFLNPAGAVLQAILAIYNTIMFFVENWDRIVTFVKTVFGGIADVAMGKLSAVAQAVERALAMTIPIILNFLARLIGLSGIGKAVSKVITKIRKPIDKIVDKVLDKIVAMTKKVFGKGKAAVAKGKEAAKGVIGKIKDFVFPKKTFKAGKESHSISFKGKAPKADVMVASRPRTLSNLLSSLEQDGGDKKTVAKARAKLVKLDDLQDDVGKIRKKLTKVSAAHPYAKGTSIPQEIKTVKDLESGKKKEIKAMITEIAFLLSNLMATADYGTQQSPLPLKWPKPAAAGYPTITLGPKSMNPISQSLMVSQDHANIEKAIGTGTNDIKRKDAWVSAGRPIVDLNPLGASRPPMGGSSVGIRAPYTIAIGTKFKLPARPPGGTPGGKKLKSVLEAYGYRFGSEGKDGDHVKEIQMGGKDMLSNLWPLDAKVNRAAGGNLSRMIFTVDNQKIPMSVLKARARSSKAPDVWFEIVSTTSATPR